MNIRISDTRNIKIEDILSYIELTVGALRKNQWPLGVKLSLFVILHQNKSYELMRRSNQPNYNTLKIIQN